MTGSFFLRSLRLLAKAESSGSPDSALHSPSDALVPHGGGGGWPRPPPSPAGSAASARRRRRRSGGRPPPLPRSPSIASTIGDASERSTGSCRISVCSSGDEALGAPVDAPDRRRRWSSASSAGGASAASSSAASTLSSSTAGGDRAVADALRSWDGAGFHPALVGQLRSAADALARGRSVLRRRSRGWATSPPASAAAAEAAAGDQVLTGSTKALAAAVRSLVLALEAERLERERAEVAARLLVPGGGWRRR
ncbi:hypothetical protein BU14_0209s0017 [Porphyra umbilicalis]|uniref:Uncharacterized protein n=1 Tax=Porphyra umbilicalis TaxID=2786 RepID=A0A1X6P5A0_PORUM|nr:hypothetical protein BU14_0209s0017 [Porphyra umbilicalis]|eukprot:OSX76024.1 hypothetical protein BU14_0209s0017 [Porphyra umbilicalis]